MPRAVGLRMLGRQPSRESGMGVRDKILRTVPRADRRMCAVHTAMWVVDRYRVRRRFRDLLKSRLQPLFFDDRPWVGCQG
jgi:hypothetical protein